MAFVDIFNLFLELFNSQDYFQTLNLKFPTLHLTFLRRYAAFHEIKTKNI